MLYDIIILATCYMFLHVMNFSKLIEYTMLRINSNVNYGFWVVMMCQYRFIDYNKCTNLGWDVDSGGSSACVEQGLCKKYLYFLL